MTETPDTTPADTPGGTPDPTAAETSGAASDATPPGASFPPAPTPRGMPGAPFPLEAPAAEPPPVEPAPTPPAEPAFDDTATGDTTPDDTMVRGADQTVVIAGMRLTRLSEEDALARLLAGKPLTDCYVPTLNLGYQTDSWVRPSDVGTTRYLARHFRVPERQPLDPDTKSIAPLDYDVPVVLRRCVVDDFSAVGAAFAKGLELSQCHLRAEARLSPPGATSASTRTIVPPTRVEGAGLTLTGTRIDGSLRLGHVTIGGGLELSRLHVHGHLHAERARIAGGIVADRLHVEGRFHLTQANVQGGLSGSQIQIDGDWHATHLDLAGDLELEEATLASLDFDDARFGDAFRLARCEFSGRLALARAALTGEVDWRFVRVADDVVADKALFASPFASYALKIGNHLRLRDATFEGAAAFDRLAVADTADFRATTFTRCPSFRYAAFFQWAIFYATRFLQGADFFSARFEGECLFNKDAVVRSDEGLDPAEHAARIGGPMSFRGTYFYRKAVFDYVRFPGGLVADFAYFAEQTSLIGATIEGAFDLKHCEVLQEIDASKASITGRLDLENANVMGRLTFTRATLAGVTFKEALIDSLVLERRQIAGCLLAEGALGTTPDPALAREEYILLRDAFGKRGKLDDEDWAYAHFKRRQRDARVRALSEPREDGTPRPRWRTRALHCRYFVEKVIFDWFGEYGTNPLRTGGLALLIIAAFGLFYTFAGYAAGAHLIWEGKEFATSAQPQDQGFFALAFANLYFSFQAFTTMGFGDVHPHFFGWLKFVVAFEAFFGVFVMTLFVGTYARKIIR